MTRSAADLLEEIQHELAPEEGENLFVPLVADGSAPLAAIGALAAEERRIVTSDWRSFLTLAARSPPGPRRARLLPRARAGRKPCPAPTRAAGRRGRDGPGGARRVPAQPRLPGLPGVSGLARAQRRAGRGDPGHPGQLRRLGRV